MYLTSTQGLRHTPCLDGISILETPCSELVCDFGVQDSHTSMLSMTLEDRELLLHAPGAVSIRFATATGAYSLSCCRVDFGNSIP
jgi:hypothetical protein